MKKLFLALGLLIVGLFLVSCVSPPVEEVREEGTEGAELEEAGEEVGVEEEVAEEEPEARAIAGQAVAGSCRPEKAKRCSGGKPQECQGGVWVNLATCQANYQCRNGNCVCINGRQRCNYMGRPQRCERNTWVDRPECSADKICLNGACICREGLRQCSASGRAQLCQNNNWVDQPVCTSNQVCRNGECVTACIDYEPQNNITVKGVVTNALNMVGGNVMEPAWDECETEGDRNILYQRSCNSDNTYSTIVHDCQTNGQVCRDGICLTPASCTDSDGELIPAGEHTQTAQSFGVRGTTTGIISRDINDGSVLRRAGSTVSLTDQCVSDTVLTEYFCRYDNDLERGILDSGTGPCSDQTPGTVCRDGACVQP